MESHIHPTACFNRQPSNGKEGLTDLLLLFY
jgi:hypothetical protein